MGSSSGNRSSALDARRIPSIGLSAAALALAGILVASTSTRAFTVIRGPLGLGARDVRVYDNFSDPEAGDNTTPDPNWPGVVGAPLALWKGVAEWSSTLHGDGSGDPSQPGDLGSGGANFDVEWEGLASGPGGLGDNTLSEIAGCSAGVVSFTETGAGGWRMRFYSCFTFDDGPGAPVAGAVDLQGLVAHEYGHVLGLGHSTSAGATMEAAATDLVAWRSIEADDRNGIQFLYGVRAAGKPRIRAVVGSQPVWIVGEGFAASGNVARFPGGDVAGLPSGAGGTAIQVAVPSSPIAGDVQVAVGAATGPELSNGWPFDPAGCARPARFCATKVNSQGCTPSIGSSGSPSATQALPFLITASDVLNQKAGVLFYGLAPAATPFQGGTLCAAGPLRRTAIQGSGGHPPPADCSGTFAFDMNARIQSGVDPALVPGAAVFAQYYYRDPPGSFGVGLTDALAFTICP